MDLILIAGGSNIVAATGGYQELKLFELLRERWSFTVVPAHDPLGRISATDQKDLNSGTAGLSGLPGNIDEQSFVGRGYGEALLTFNDHPKHR